MTTNNNNDGLPWKAEEEHLIWISFVIVSPSREDAYKKVLKWYKANGENGSYPEDCIESGYSDENFPLSRCVQCGGSGVI